MKYKLEFMLIGAEQTASRTIEFDADSDEEAASKVASELLNAEVLVNRGIQNIFWHFQAKYPKLAKIIQSEISQGVHVLSQ